MSGKGDLMNNFSKKAILTIAALGISLMPVFANGAGEYETGHNDSLWLTAKSIADDSASVFPDSGKITVQEIDTDGEVVAESTMTIDFYEDSDDEVIYADVTGNLPMTEEVAAFSTGYFENPFVSGDQTWLVATGDTVVVEGKECVEYKYRNYEGDDIVTGMVYIDKDSGVPVRVDTELSVDIDDSSVDVVRSLYYGYDGSKLFPVFSVLQGTISKELENQDWLQDIVITQEFDGYFVADEASL